MESLMKTKLKLHLVLLALLSLAGFAHGQGTAISYQGRLNQAGTPATGLYDFTFAVFAAEAGGAALAGPDELNAEPVTNGLFNVSLDFGRDIFTGAKRWLEIAVRTNGSVAAYSILSPRQALTPSPYAIFATTSGTASNMVNGSVVKSLNGLNDIVRLTAGSNVTITPSGNTLTIASAAAGASGLWSVNGNNAYYAAGNVGIGTTTPARKLTVRTSSLDYGIEHTDGTVRLGTYLDGAAGWLGTISNHPLKFFVNDGAVPSMTIDGGSTSIASGPGFVAVGTPNGESGTSIKRGDNRADIRFDGSTLKLVAGPGAGPPSSMNGIVVSTAGNVGIGTTTPGAKLHAETSQTYTAAVYGNATGDGGVGVYAQSASGTAVYADGNARQSLDKGGFVKAMLYVKNGGIVRCFNGINNTSTDGCGFVVTRNEGLYRINFGFPVSDRFVSLTTEFRTAPNGALTNPTAHYRFFDSTTVEIVTFCQSCGAAPDDFMIILY
jgi:hypothetical protein